jgi:signal transduction histidine kinase
VTPRRDASSKAAGGGTAPRNRDTTTALRRKGVNPRGPATSGSSRPDEQGGGLLTRLQNLRVRNRLILLVLVPLIATVVLATIRLGTAFSQNQTYERVHYLATVSRPVSDLIGDLENERDATAQYLADGRPTALLQIVRQEQSATTAQLKALTPIATSIANNPSYDSSVGQAFGEANARLQDLDLTRDSALKTRAPVSQSFAAYTDMIDDLVAANAQIATGSSDRELEALAQSVNQLEQLEEQTSGERGYIVDLLGGGSDAQQSDEENLQLANAQAQSAEDVFNNSANPGLVNEFRDQTSGADSDSAAKNIDAVIQASEPNSGETISGLGLNGAIVFRQITAQLTGIRNVEVDAINQTIARADTLQANAKNDMYVNIGVIIGILLLALLGTLIIARSMVGPLQTLRSSALDIAVSRLPDVVRRLERADLTKEKVSDPMPIEVSSTDEIGQVARAFDEVHRQAITLASEQALLRNNVNAMFVNLSRRSQGLVQRQLRLIDELENSEQDPDQLANLFKLDHLATRMRRNGENLLVLAGEEPGRRWSQAVLLLDVLRAAASEVEQYERVMLRDLPTVNVVGRVVNDLVHLVAELLENATSFSAPETKVSVTANPLNTGGVMLEIEDAGIGMTPEELDDANERLSTPPVVDVAVSRRMGLFVVGRLATRHGIEVRMRRSAAGGITALALLPPSLIETPGEQGRPNAGDAREIPSPAGGDANLPRRVAGGPRRAELPAGPFERPAAGASGVDMGAGTGTHRVIGEPRDERPSGADTGTFARHAGGTGQFPQQPAGAGSGQFPQQSPGGTGQFPQQPAGAGSGQFPQQSPGGTGQFPQQGPGGTGQFQRPTAGSGTGQFQQPAGTGQFQRPQRPGNPRGSETNQFPQQGPATDQFPQQRGPSGSGQFELPNVGAGTGQFGYEPSSNETTELPRVSDQPDEAPQGTDAFTVSPFTTDSFAPSAFAEPTAAPPASDNMPALYQKPEPPAPMPLSNALPAPVAPAGPPAVPTANPPGFELPAGYGAAATDERLPIYEAMESEWFRRRSAARNRPTPLPPMSVESTRTPRPEDSSTLDSTPRQATPSVPQAAPSAPRPPAPTSSFIADVTPPPASTIDQPAADRSTTERHPSSGTGRGGGMLPPPRSESPRPSAPAEPAASHHPAQEPAAAQGPERRTEAPSVASAAKEKRSMDNAADTATSQRENWQSPGDEGWKAAESVAKPVAAGLTPKGLPKRVPRSNLVPGSAGAAKATPPVIPPRSAEAVRGRLSSFHQGLRQGRDAAGKKDESAPPGGTS